MPSIASKTSTFSQGRPSFGDVKITSTSTERQKRSQNLAPVLVIIFENSLVFSRKIITSTGFYRCCAVGASAPVVVKNQPPKVADLDVTDLRSGGFRAEDSVLRGGLESQASKPQLINNESNHPCHPKPSLTKLTLLIFRSFLFFLALIVRMFRIFRFFAAEFYCFSLHSVVACPGLIRMFRTP